MTVDPLERVGAEVSRHMDEILSLFKPGCFITVTVRFPGRPDLDFMMSNDMAAEVIAMVQRREEAAKGQARA